MTQLALRSGEAAVFGYGSLLSRSSLERTLGRAYDGPFVPCALRGWRRSWDVAMPNEAYYALHGGHRLMPRYILYLNVRPDAGSLVNGVAFVVTAAELAALDAREWIYDRRDVTGALEGVRVTGGAAYLYVAKPEHVLRDVDSPDVAAVRASYLAIVDAGLRAFDPAFRSDFERTSDAVPRHLVIDDRRDEPVTP
jgi:cation transport regulator ChaC